MDKVLGKGSTRAVQLEFGSHSGTFEAKSLSFLTGSYDSVNGAGPGRYINANLNLQVARLTCQTMEELGENQLIG